VITGASRVSQVEDNMAALDVIPLITDDVRRRVDEAVAGMAR
jgi:aryl-alcohol dehydrogenase-like predicted oxidoreductase